MNVDTQPFTQIVPIVALPTLTAVVAYRTEMAERLSPSLHRFSRTLRRLGQAAGATPTVELTDTQAERLLDEVRLLGRAPFDWSAVPELAEQS